MSCDHQSSLGTDTAGNRDDRSCDHQSSLGTDTAEARDRGQDEQMHASENNDREIMEPRHRTILRGDAASSVSVSLHRCSLQNCCDNRVHCPFCDVRQYKPTQHARVRDHLHLTHFQHAVYYNGMMVVKCFHSCRSNSTKGGHYHCPVCGTTLLKRNAFTSHLLSHAAKQGLDVSAVHAPDAKTPSVVYYDDHKISLCHLPTCNANRESSLVDQPHFHCPLCRQICAQLSALTAHLWRCEKRAVTMSAKVDMTGYSLNVPKLFSPDMVQGMPCLKDLTQYQWHLSIVRNLSDLPLTRCELPDCCKGRYHCPLCTTAKLKPNHLCHIRQHFLSHWRSGVPFQSYTVLVCYLPCELHSGTVDRIRFHYHCPLCGATRRRRQGFARHLEICDPSRPADSLAAEEQMGEEMDGVEWEEEGGGAQMDKFPVDGDTFVPLSEADAWSSQPPNLPLPPTRRASAEQAELQAAESLVHMDLRIHMESLSKASCPSAFTSTNRQSLDRSAGSSHNMPGQTLDRLSGSSHNRPGQPLDIFSGSSHNMPGQTLDRSSGSSHNMPGQTLDRSSGSSHNMSGQTLDRSSGSSHNISEQALDRSSGSFHNMPDVNLIDRSTESGHASCLPKCSCFSDKNEVMESLDTEPDDVWTRELEDKLTEWEHPSTLQPVKKYSEPAREIMQADSRPPQTESSDSSAARRSMTAVGEGNVPETQGSTLNPGSEAELGQVSGEKASGSSDLGAAASTAVGCCGRQTYFAEQRLNESDSISHSMGVDGITATADSSHNSGVTVAAVKLQIFQQVSTQISDSIVHELQKQGILEESLQLIGQMCQVTWQQRDDTVTMTSDLETLCRAQSCFQQILKEGLQNLKEQPALPAVSGTTPAACQPVRKRGRPKGSRNKATLTEEQEDGSASASKCFRQSDGLTKTSAAKQAVKASLQQQCLLDSMSQTSEESGYVDSLQNKAVKCDSPVMENTRRTRGKRINFAQLNAGNLSPLHDRRAEEAGPSSDAAFGVLTAGKRGRGRPKKSLCAAMESALVEDNGTAHANLKSNGTSHELPIHCFQKSQASSSQSLDWSSCSHDGRNQVLCSERASGNSATAGSRNCETICVVVGDKTQDVSGAEGKQKLETPSCPGQVVSETSICAGQVVSETSSCPGQVVSETSSCPGQVVSETPNCPGQVVWIPYVSPVSRKVSRRAANSPSMPVVITTPRTLPTAVPIGPNLNLSFSSRTRQPTSQPHRQHPITHLTEDQAGKDEEKDKAVQTADSPTITGISGEAGKVVKRARSPAITRRIAGLRQHRNSTASFAIIPSVVFDCVGDVEEGDQSAKQSRQKSNTDKSVDMGDVDSEREGKSETGTETGTDSTARTRFPCPMCTTIHDTYSLLSEHMLSKHPKKKAVTCDVCQAVFPTHGALMLHLQRRHGPQPQVKTVSPYRCEKCGKECMSSTSLNWHGTLVHKEERDLGHGTCRLKCGLCAYVAVDSWDMKHHRQQHRHQPPACFICTKKFGTEASLKIHMAAKHLGQSYSCSLCHKSFAHMRYLRSHLQRHGGEKRHICPVCGWRFFQTNTLKAHMDTHKPKGQRSYSFKCPHCPAAYNSAANYRDHLNKHTGARPHMCGQCGRGFAFRSMLTTHMAFVHSSSRPHVCTECDKKYKTKTQLRQHQMIHTMTRTGSSPFMCPKCSRPMASKARLRAHTKRCKGGNFLWHQKVATPGGQQTKVKSVKLITGQPVSIVDLLPGQHIKVVQHGFGKETTFTLVPIHGDGAQQYPAITGPTDHKVVFNIQQDLNPQLSELSTNSSQTLTIPAHTVPGYDGGEGQQTILVSNDVAAESVSSMVNDLGDLPHNHAGVDATANNSGSTLIAAGSSSSPVLMMNGGQTLSLLSSISFPQLQQSLSSNRGHALQPAGFSQLQARSDAHTFPSQTFHAESFQPETLLHSASSSHQLVLSDGLVQTQTLLLPSDLVNQEVVVIETEEGQQNILSLSNVEFVQADTLLQQPGVEWQTRSSRHKDSTVPAHFLPGRDIREQNLAFHAHNSQVDMTAFPLHNSQGVQEVDDVQNTECDIGEQDFQNTEEFSGPQEEVSVYICSICDQQFTTMELAQQHVLLMHTLDPPPPINPSDLEEMESSICVETQDHQAVVSLPDEQSVA